MTDETPDMTPLQPKRSKPPARNPFGQGVPAPRPGRPYSGSRRARNEALRSAAQRLGATDEELSEVEQATLQRLSVTDAARMLGGGSMKNETKRRQLGSMWRHQTLMRFNTKAGRRWLVSTLETEFTGEETEIPAEVLEAIEHGLASDRKRPADAPMLHSVWHAARTYRALADQHHGRETR